MTAHLRAAWANRIVQGSPWTIGPDSDRCTESVLMQFGVFGKRPRDGLGVLEALQNAGWTYRAVEIDGEPFRGTVRQFYERFKEGKFYFATSGHAMALVDGLLVDSAGKGPDGRRVIGAFEVYRPGEQKRTASVLDARRVGAALRRAGFERSISSGTRVRGAPHVSRGYEVETYLPLESERGEYGSGRVIKVRWWQSSGITRDYDKDEARRQVVAMAIALQIEGYKVIDRGSHLVVRASA